MRQDWAAPDFFNHTRLRLAYIERKFRLFQIWRSYHRRLIPMESQLNESAKDMSANIKNLTINYPLDKNIIFSMEELTRELIKLGKLPSEDTQTVYFICNNDNHT
jgi:hypothetical protein